jgi:hypothetical protein
VSGRRNTRAATLPEHKSPTQPPGTGYRWLPIDDRILDILAAHHGPAGICPSIPRLGKLLGVSGRYVRKRLETMEDAGIVRRIHVFERDDDREWQQRGHRSSHLGRQTSSSYRLLQFRGPPELLPIWWEKQKRRPTPRNCQLLTH